jgi:hypothetical protein
MFGLLLVKFSLLASLAIRSRAEFICQKQLISQNNNVSLRILLTYIFDLIQDSGYFGDRFDHL